MSKDKLVGFPPLPFSVSAGPVEIFKGAES